MEREANIMEDEELVQKIEENPYKIKLIGHTKGPPTCEISVNGKSKEQVYAEMKELYIKFMQDFGRG